MTEILIRRFDGPDERRTFEHGTFDLVNIAGTTIGRAGYAPGWRWSTHVGAATGEAFCQVEHLGFVMSGRAAVQMADGTETVLEPGDLFHIAPGHDSWVVGDEPHVSLHLSGASDYAARD